MECSFTRTHLVLLDLVDGGGELDNLMLEALTLTVDPKTEV